MSSGADQALAEANECLRRGDLLRAQELAQGVLRRQPRDVRALEALAATAFQDARYDDARMFLGRCRRLKPKEGKYHVREAQVLQTEGRYGEALAALQRARQAGQGVNVSPLNEAVLHRLMGEREAARRLVEPLLESKAEGPAAGLELAEIELAEGNAARAEGIAVAQLARGEALSSDMRRQFLFLRGQACEKLKRYDDAFACFSAANDLWNVEFDAEAFVELSERVMRAMSRQALRALPRAGEASDAPVFVVGMPRSGTTLIERIIDAHPQAAGAGELPDLTRMVRHLPHELGRSDTFPECVAGLTPREADRLAREYLRRLRQVGGKAQRVANKNLDLHLYVGLISLLFPGARVVHVERDPVDVGLSCFASALLPQNQPWSTRLEDIALAQREFERLMEHWREATHVPILSVCYEELVAEQEAQTRRLIEFLGVEWDDACLRHHESGRASTSLSNEQVRRPVYTSSVKRSEHYGAHLEPLRRALVKYGVSVS